MDEIEAKIREAGLRMTKPREHLIEVLREAPRPLSAEEIIAASPESGSLDLVTVYRNLGVFVEQGLAQSIQLEGGKQLFELRTGDHDHHHHHIVCRNCHQVVCLDICFGGELEKYARQLGFSKLTHTIEVYGLCKDCSGGVN